MSSVVTRDAIKQAVEDVPTDQLEGLYRYVKNLTLPKKSKNKDGESFMSKMRKISIDAPPDFSRNIDLYLSGEKSIE